jgi:hypothetical protein
MIGEYSERGGLRNKNEVGRVAESSVRDRFYFLLSYSGY